MKWLSFLCFLVMFELSAQDKLPPPSKVPPTLVGFKKLHQDKAQNFFVVTSDVDSLKQFLSQNRLHQQVISEYRNSNLFVIRTSWRIIDSLFIPSHLITFIDTVRSPREETIIDGFDLALNKLNLVHDQFKTINGSATVVSVKENKPDTTDIDLKGRFVTTTFASSIITSHATIMSTIIGGAGNSYITGKGAAWGASLTSSNFASLLPDSDADYQKYSIAVQNHSYGTAIENYYGADAAAYDASTISNPFLLHVFSAGNSGDKTSTAGAYSGIAGFANLTGSFKMAKNVLTVGAIDSRYQISSLSSKGPTYDGRVSPHLVAFGQDGSSGAAALVSGTALLLQQAYKETGNGQSASSALIKSVLVNSADDVGPNGIDFQSGYGNLNAFEAMQTIINKRYFSGAVANGEQQTHSFILPPNVHGLKVTICWNDDPAIANNNRALMNDIDMRLLHTGSGTSWQPWVLRNAPHRDSLTAAPIRTRDSINNIEQITIDNPPAGSYTIEVNGIRIQPGVQSYYVSYQWDSTNQFKWQYPTSTDQIVANSDVVLRWKSTFATSTAELYYSLDDGNIWTLVSDKIDLNKSHIQWPTPGSHGHLLFKMVVDGKDFFSDTSVISSRLMTRVGFNCTDSFSIYWNGVPNISSYTVYRLGNTYLEPLQATNDTSIILIKSNNLSMHYAIAPNIKGRPALKSYTFNYTAQGSGCYIRNFLVDLVNTNAGNILLELGTTFNVKQVVIEKLTSNGFVAIHSSPNAPVLKYNLTDTTLLRGGNSYRAKIHLADGQAVYSQVETIYYLPDTKYLVFPNPANTYFRLVSKDTDNSELVLYNLTGQKVLTKKITSPVENIAIHQLKRGYYFIVILQKNKKIFQGSLIVQ